MSAPGLGYYDFGLTTVHACTLDQRFSWCAYVPRDYAADGTDRYRLLVAVHGTGRFMHLYRELFTDYAERTRSIVLAPLFPAGITGPEDLSSYKLLRPCGIRYDEILLAMVDAAAAKYRLVSDRFALFGFSGGGHFTHRFLYMHPDRLEAASIGAPGVVTLLDPEHDFWVGVRNFEAVWGRPIDLDAMRRVPVQMVVGGDDTETWEITIAPGSTLWMPGADLAGRNRQDRMIALKASFENAGIAVRHDVVPGVAHRVERLIPAVQDFLEQAATGGGSRAG